MEESGGAFKANGQLRDGRLEGKEEGLGGLEQEYGVLCCGNRFLVFTDYRCYELTQGRDVLLTAQLSPGSSTYSVILHWKRPGICQKIYTRKIFQVKILPQGA